MVSVNRRDFASALKRACKLAPKSSIPALRNVCLTVDGESLMLKSTNLDQSIVEVLPVIGNGNTKLVSLCVPTLPLLGVVQALPQFLKEVPLDARADCVIVGTTKLATGCPMEDYHVIPKVPGKADAVIELPNDFMQHVRFVSPAVSEDLTRFALKGICFDFAHGNIVASNGKVLHCAHLWQPTKLTPAIVPPAVFNLDVPTQMVLPNPNKDGTLKEVFFLTQTGYIATTTIEGTFPDYLNLVRNEHTLTAVMERAELLAAVEQALPMMNERDHACSLHLNEHFQIRAENRETGAEYINEVSASLDGAELKTSLNPYFLRNMLRGMAGEGVTLAFRKPDEAIHIFNDADDQWALLMPLDQK